MMEQTKKMSVRGIVTALTTGCRTMVDFDAVVSRNGGYGAHCPGCSPAEFSYEWEAAKLRVRSAARRQRRDEEV